MSKRRKSILPGSGCWDSFFDKGVQRVLLQRFRFNTPPPRPAGEKALEFSKWRKVVQTEFLAWPVIAYRTAEGLATATTSNRRQMAEEVTDCYATDSVFFAELLAAVSRYHTLPVSERSLPRRISDVSSLADLNSPPIDPNANDPEPVQLMDWKTVAAHLGSANSINQMMVEFNRESKRRLKIEDKWRPHFGAYWSLSETRRQILPLQWISF